MATQTKIHEDYDRALRTRQMPLVETLRLVLSAIKNREIEKRGKTGASELSEEEVIEVVTREVKKRKEAIELYAKGGRQDLVDKEQAELKIIEVYLPPLMSEDDIRDIVKNKLADLGNPPASDFGKTMGVIMKDLKGKADAQLVTKVVKELMK